MPYLKLPSQTPPGGWRYFQPDSRLWFNGNDQGFAEMVERISKHRKFRGFQRQSEVEVAEDVHTQLCERLGPMHCKAEKGSNWFHIKRDFSMNIDGETAIAGSKALLSFLKSGRETVPMEQAKDRAATCMSCHLNTPEAGCSSCSSLSSTTAKLLPKERRIPGLSVCAACGCGLQLKVNVPLSVVREADDGRNLSYPDYCWVTKESLQNEKA